MFERVFEDYHAAVESSLKLQQELYRQWMNGWPIKLPEVTSGGARGTVEDQIRAYRKQWTETLAATLDQHRVTLDSQFRSGIQAIESAFRTTEAKTPEEYWRLTQEFWRKSIDSFKTAFEAQTKYLQALAEMWIEMATRGRV